MGGDGGTGRLTAFGCTMAVDGLGVGVERAADRARGNNRPSEPSDQEIMRVRERICVNGEEGVGEGRGLTSAGTY